MDQRYMHNSIIECVISSFFFVFLVQSISFSQAYGQAFSVSGRILASRYSVRNASVTFIDEADTTRKFSALTDSLGNYQIGLTTSIESAANILPTQFSLGQNYPNPFSSSTAIPYEINKESNIQVTIYDILGRAVRKFSVGRQAVGTHSVSWDGVNDFGTRVANGIYFYKLDVHGESRVGKMVFNKVSNGTVLLPIASSPNRMPLKANAIQNVQGTAFTARIENTATTSPAIAFKETVHIVIEKDTTLNFSVTYIPLAVIEPDVPRQNIRGFGASNIILWRPDMTDSEIETAFGTGEGQLGFSILRIMIEADSSRWSLYVPTAKKAQDRGATIIASPWYAPDALSEAVDTIQRVRHDKYAEYAAHLNSFNSYMQNNGVTVYGISAQNEPDIEGNWTSWTSGEMLTFMRDYANAIEGTNVMAPESFHFDRTYSDPILNDSIACANTDIICGHIYGGGLGQYPLAQSKGKEVWMTEYLSGENSQANDLTWAVSAAQSINDAMASGMSAYVWWYIVRFYGPISDGMNGSGNKGDVTKKGYMMSQFSRFVRPGYYRIQSSNIPSVVSTSVTAYKDPVTSKVVIVAINAGTTPVQQIFRIQNATTITTVLPYVTSGTENCEVWNYVPVVDGSFTYSLEPSSVTTFISN
jgi:glucuronoarabinoxylan endo-1,4-beta-xylanase